jgi:hypothetical protein
MPAVNRTLFVTIILAGKCEDGSPLYPDGRSAHGYVREDHVLDQELPLWVPIPALAEIQVALEQAVSEVTGLAGFESV